MYCCTYAAKSLTGFISEAQKLSQSTFRFFGCGRDVRKGPVLFHPIVSLSLCKVMYRQICVLPSILFFSAAMGKIMAFNNKVIFLNILESDFLVGDESRPSWIGCFQRLCFPVVPGSGDALTKPWRGAGRWK